MSKKGGTSTHTSFYRGAKIRIIFRDGAVVIGKFLEKLSEKKLRVQLASGKIEDIRTADLSSCNYYKPLPHERALQEKKSSD